MKSIKALFIVTSQDTVEESDDRTGVWLEEIADPYYVFTEAGADITIASMEGGAIPLDPKSLSIIVATRQTKRFLGDVMAMEFLANSIKLQEARAIDFDVVFLTGAHGAMYDLADNKIVKQLLENFNIGDKPIASVCYGVVGLVSLQNEHGELLIKGRKLTCFSNSEEKSARIAGIAPFILETKLVSLGAFYSKGPDYTSHVVVDGNIITGQNPASANEVAKVLLAQAQHNKTKYLYSDNAIFN
jgi:putative intracellular protease/amidase